MRFYFTDTDQAAAHADRAHRHRDCRLDDHARLAARGGVRVRALAAGARLHRRGADVLRDPRAVGVHEHRDGLRAAARGRARAHVHARLRGERGDDRGVHDLAGRVRRRGRARAAAGQLRRLGDRRARAVVGAARARVAAREASRTCARCCTSDCPRCRPTRACTRCRSPIASTCCAASARAWPASTRSRCSWRPSCSCSCAASSTRGRRWHTRSTATPRPRACTRW